ncbi:MAG TPA: hypothetical protein VGB67_15335, partial [Fibrella sp.]
DVVPVTTTFNVFEETATTPNCFASSPLTITIIAVPDLDADDYTDVTACDQYILPNTLPAGATYHTATNGGGQLLPPSTPILTTTEIFVYQQTGTSPNCTDEESFIVTINNTPGVPVVSNQTVCDEYVLLPLPAGSTYHTAPGGTGTTLPAGYQVTTTQTIYVYAQTNTNPNCTSEASFTVTVNDTPEVDDLADVVACDSYILPDLLIGGTYYSGPGGTGTSYVAGDVIQSSMLPMYIYDQTGTNPNCFAETSFNITIHELPVIVNPTPYELCDDNADTVACFNLTTKNAEIAPPNTVVTYHETATDAANGVLAVNAANYCNTLGTGGIQTMYVRVTPVGAPQCPSFTTLTLIVNPRPIVPATPVADFAKCDYNNTGDGFEVFDLTQMNTALLGGQTNTTVSYYLNTADAEGGANPIANPTAYTNTTNPQQICARLENNNTGCYSVVCFNLRVDALPVINAPAPMQMCNDGITNDADFDLAGNDAFITNNTPGMQVTYHLTQADANNEVGALPSPYTSGPKTLIVRVEDVATNCFVTTTLTLNVNQGPVAIAPTPLQVCDPNNDGFAEFDLHSKDIEISGGNLQTGVVITYHETATDAQNGVLAITQNPYPNDDPWLQVVYVRVAFISTGCTAFTTLQLIVNPTPEANENAQDLEVCDDNADGVACFDLNQATTNILNGIDPAMHTVTYHVLQASAQSDTNAIANLSCYTNSTADAQTIYVRVEHNTSGCFDVVPLDLIVNPLPVVAFPIPSYTLCDVNPGSQSEVFDLASQIPNIAGAGMEVTFHFSAAEAEAGTGDLPLSYTAGPVQTIHVRVTNIDTGCYETSTMDLRVEPIPAPIHPLPGDPLLNLCDLNGDGYAVFNLQGLVPAMQQNTNSFTVTFHETEIDANNGNFPIPTPSAYANNNPYTETIWVRATNTAALNCSVVFPIVLNVIPAPVIAPGSLDDLSQCDTDNNNQNGVSVFDLTAQNADILAQQSGPATAYIISYYTSQSAALAGTGRILNPASHSNNGSPFTQTIWVRVEDAASECAAIESFVITVDTPLALTTPSAYSMCDDNQDDNNTPSATFDLTVKNAEILGTPPPAGNYTVAFFLT